MLNTDIIKEFHVHVYFDQDTKHIAEEIYKELEEHVMDSICGELGKLHDKAIGPHTKLMFAITEVGVEDSFLRIAKWFILNRKGLSVLIHPVTDQGAVFDHTNVLWIGTPVLLNLDKL